MPTPQALVLMPVLALAFAQEPRPADERPMLERPGLVELTLPPLEQVHVEWFRIDAPAGAMTEPDPVDSEADATPRPPSGPAAPLGLVRRMRVPEPDGTLRLESETLYLDAGLRVALVERLELESLDLVWREVGRHHGRTVHVAWDRGTEVLHLADTSGGEVHRREVDATGEVLMPLYLLEMQRAGRLSAGEFRRLDPNACTLEVLRYAPRPMPLLPGAAQHTWRRADGTLAGRYIYLGDELAAFQLQEGGPLARAIPRAEYEALRVRHWPGPAGR